MTDFQNSVLVHAFPTSLPTGRTCVDDEQNFGPNYTDSPDEAELLCCLIFLLLIMREDVFSSNLNFDCCLFSVYKYVYNYRDVLGCESF